MNKKKAFTLAEVLIVLSIIGIIAENTIPTVVKNVEDTKSRVAYRKAFSAANQALTTAKALDLFQYESAEGTAAHVNNFVAFMNQFKTIKQCTSSNNAECWDANGEKYGKKWGAQCPYADTYAFLDTSGMAWSMYYVGMFRILVDTNSFKKPNQYGIDRFAFYVSSEEDYYGAKGIPSKISPVGDNGSEVCYGNVCESKSNYYGTSWLSGSK